MNVFAYPEPLADLVMAFSRLPGIGPKTAGRLAFYLLRHEDVALKLAGAAERALREITACEICGNYTDVQPCRICAAANRDRTMLCVVEQARDVASLEKTGEYNGYYHVLGGVLSPLDGIGPDQLNIASLLRRLTGVNEVVFALNPTVEGEATAAYLSGLLKPLGATVSRIAHGLPVGGDLEYADEVTIARALEGRRRL
ncbi:MAG: recombination mediator RecR [Gracilibacteraceae bacterium]|jgi:recombination protein RecR|nr:recombination mediator RecR [Gracilibacteraceae bacterium]